MVLGELVELISEIFLLSGLGLLDAVADIVLIHRLGEKDLSAVDSGRVLDRATRLLVSGLQLALGGGKLLPRTICLQLPQLLEFLFLLGQHRLQPGYLALVP